MVNSRLSEIIIGASVDSAGEPLSQAVTQCVSQLLAQGLLHVVGRQVTIGVVKSMYAVVHQKMVVQHGVVAHVIHSERGTMAPQVTQAVPMAHSMTFHGNVPHRMT